MCAIANIRRTDQSGVCVTRQAPRLTEAVENEFPYLPYYFQRIIVLIIFF